MNDTKRMKELVALLGRASEAYYAKDEEIISNFEYDRLYDELVQLEAKTGVTLANSPTVHVGYAAVDELPKERHAQPMLSLDKTKSREELRDWLNGHEALLSWKLDGLTVVLTYAGGELVKAVTRGNGEIGEVITGNARVFENVPLRIPFQGNLVLRGEAVISYSDFEKINARLEEEAASKSLADEEAVKADVRYKNPRNLCSGSVRQLDSAVTAQRHVQFYAFSLVLAEGTGASGDAAGAAGSPPAASEGTFVPAPDFHNSRKAQFDFLAQQGFDVVQYRMVTPATILPAIEQFEKDIQHYDLPSDGLVLLLEDIAYGESLGRTAKFPRNSIAFKWADETQDTILREVEWSASRTGLINPVAIFDPVELEGTTVRRASVHNVSIVRGLKLGLGDTIRVYKANMIIPQIAENLTGSDTLEIPDTCPVCGGETQIRSENDAESLYCTNPDCPAKKIKAFTLFVSRPAMNIDGLSEMTLEKFVGRGIIHQFTDIYHLEAHRDEIVDMEGFGGKSYENLIAAVDASRHTELRRVLTALGIPGIGSAGARLICAHFGDDPDKIRSAGEEELSAIDGIGPVLARNFADWFADDENRARFDALLEELTIERPQEAPEPPGGNPISGKTFVVTGSVEHFANRDELKEFIENRGGKVSGSVSKKTDYLINNDVNSTSGKNKKAKELGIPILSEEDFMRMVMPQADSSEQ